ncbi:MAG TPA: PrsW family glutamic-type intramembrane protease [Polyangiaceae bacterium]|nr:PrsW family glutamic-type intramembrane protease [Polyangiaceae bacterium]
MSLLFALLAVSLSVLPAYLVFRRVSVLGRASRRLTGLALALGAAAAVATLWIERAMLSFTELSFDVRVAGAGSALLASFLLAAPLEEAAKTLVVWPLYRMRRIDTPQLGLCYTVATASGFAAALGVFKLLTTSFTALLGLRVLCQIPAHLFFTGVWGYALGARRGQSRSWFAAAWLAAVAMQGLYGHIVWGRGAGFLIAVVPLLGFMVLAAASVLREVTPERQTLAKLHLPEPPRLSLVTDALNPRDQPLLLRWVVLGAFVNVGLMFALLVGAIALGHRLGVDFSAADESDMTSAGPLALLGAALLVSFPIAGYLIARASSSIGVLEPALSAALALAAIVAILALVAPLGVLFALAVAPLAFGLACGGAWIGLER